MLFQKLCSSVRVAVLATRSMHYTSRRSLLDADSEIYRQLDERNVARYLPAVVSLLRQKNRFGVTHLSSLTRTIELLASDAVPEEILTPPHLVLEVLTYLSSDQAKNSRFIRISSMALITLSSDASLTVPQLKPYWLYISAHTFPQKPKIETLLNVRLMYALSALQEANEEVIIDDLESILQYIVRSDHDSTEVVLKKVCETIDTRRIGKLRSQAILSGVVFKALNNLLELGCIASFFRLIDCTLDSIDDDFLIPYVFKRQSNVRFTPLYSSPTDIQGAAETTYNSKAIDNSFMMNDRIFQILSQRMKIFSPTKQESIILLEDLDLLVACICFSNEPKSSSKYRLLERIESFYLNSGKFSDFDAIRLVKTMLVYASVGRHRDDIFQNLEEVQYRHSMYSSLTLRQKMTILYSNAKLARCSECNIAFANEILVEAKCSPVNNDRKFLSDICRTLWSMAALKLLNEDHFEIVNIYIDICKTKFSVNSPQVFQLRQVSAELSIVNKFSHRSKVSDRDGLTSSWTHQDISKMLSSLGIKHENEKEVEYNYIVDIFIAPADVECLLLLDPSFEKNIHSLRCSKGLILEVDGPSHFDSYLSRPLGSTDMKKRHLIFLGYHLASISLLEPSSYDLNTPRETKLKLIRLAIQRSLTLTA